MVSDAEIEAARKIAKITFRASMDDYGDPERAYKAAWRAGIDAVMDLRYAQEDEDRNRV